MLQAWVAYVASAKDAVNMTQSDPVALLLLNVGENIWFMCLCYLLT